MDEKELKKAAEEFRKSADTLTNLAIQRMVEFEAREGRIYERKISLIISLSSLSIAIVGIINPLYLGLKESSTNQNPILTSCILLTISALYGLGLIIFFNEKEPKFSKSQNDLEQQFINKQIDGTMNIHLKALDGTLKEEDMITYWNTKEGDKKNYDKEIDPVIDYHKLFDKLYYLFLVIFSLGFLLFGIVLLS